MKPIRIALPGGDYVAGIVPWRCYKAINRLAGVSSLGITEDDWYNLAGLVVDIFGHQFGVNDLKGKSPAELISFLNMVMTRVSELTPKAESEVETQSTPARSNWFVDLEISLVNRFGWSLHDLDLTDVESLFRFISGLNNEVLDPDLIFCDQVDTLLGGL